MKKIVFKIDGMMCGMCEAHVSDAVRKNYPVKKVTSSHVKGETTIIADDACDEQAIKKAVEATGYVVTEVSTEKYEKKSLFSFLKK